MWEEGVLVNKLQEWEVGDSSSLSDQLQTSWIALDSSSGWHFWIWLPIVVHYIHSSIKVNTSVCLMVIAFWHLKYTIKSLKFK